MSELTPRVIPNAGSLPRPWLWQLWAAIIVGFLVTFAAQFAFRSPVSVSSPTLSFLGDTCTATFAATNNTKERISASFLVIVGLGTPGRHYAPPAYTEFARQSVAAEIAPRQTVNLSCALPIVAHRSPNTARVEVTLK